MPKRLITNKRITVTMPDGTEEVLHGTDAAHYAVVYRGNYGRWCLYGVHFTQARAEEALDDYKEEVGSSWPDSHPMVTDQVVTTKMPSLDDRNPFPNGLPR